VIRLAKAAPREPISGQSADDGGTVSLLGNVLREDAIRAAYTLKSAVAYDRGDLDEALAILEEGVAESETKVELIYQMANLYRREGDREKENAMILRATEEAPGNASAQLVLSAYLGQQGDLPGALEAARAAVAAEPGNRPAQLREAELLVDLGFAGGSPEQIQAGRAIVDEVLEAEPDSPEAHFVKAKIELAEGDLEAAKKSLETTLQSRPGWAQARFVLGSALAASGELTRARVELEGAVENDPRLTDARSLLTRVYAQLGEHEFAIESGRAYLKDRPEDSAIRIVVGQSLIRLGRSEEAYREIDQIPESQRDAAALFALGRLDLAFQRVDEGAAKLRRAEELSPGNPQVLRALLAIDRNQGNLESSLDRIGRAIEENPDSSELAELDAEVKLLGGDLDGARAALERAISLEPRNTTAQLALADLERRSGNVDGMISVIEGAASAVPESSDLQFRLAQAYEQRGRQADAVVAYEKAISLNPDLAMAKNNLAYLLAETGGDLDRAYELAQQAKELLPDDGNAADTLGWVLVKRGVPSAAIVYLQEAAERFPQDALEVQGIVHNHLAEAYELNDEADKAISASRRAVDFYERLAKLAEERGVEFTEPEWSAQAKARASRLQAAS
jgi:tetratricopeptide (TPR) repeat protein